MKNAISFAVPCSTARTLSSLAVDTLTDKLYCISIKQLSPNRVRVVKFAIVIVVAVVALLGLLAIVPQGPDLSERCARELVASAKSLPTQASVSHSGAQVSVGGRQVRLSARIENRERAENKFFVGLAVDLFVDGVFQPLTVGSVGVGDTEEEAEETAVQQWA